MMISVSGYQKSHRYLEYRKNGQMAATQEQLSGEAPLPIHRSRNRCATAGSKVASLEFAVPSSGVGAAWLADSELM
jgi:hypothetical protein